MKTSIFYQFTKSLYSFKHIAAFRMMKIRSVLSYLFFLAFLLCFPLIIAFLLSITAKNRFSVSYLEQKIPFLLTSLHSSSSDLIFIPVVFLFYYLFISFIVVIKAAVYGSLGFVAAEFLKKKCDYRSLFRMAAYSMTLPVLIAAAGEYLQLQAFIRYSLDFGLTMLILIVSIRFLPASSR